MQSTNSNYVYTNLFFKTKNELIRFLYLYKDLNKKWSFNVVMF